MLTLIATNPGEGPAPSSPPPVKMEDFGMGLMILGGVVLVVCVFLILKRKLG